MQKWMWIFFVLGLTLSSISGVSKQGLLDLSRLQKRAVSSCPGHIPTAEDCDTHIRQVSAVEEKGEETDAISQANRERQTI